MHFTYLVDVEQCNSQRLVHHVQVIQDKNYSDFEFDFNVFNAFSCFLFFSLKWSPGGI